MKTSLLIIVLALIFSSIHAQLVNVKKTFGNAMTNQANSSINNEVNKGVNAIFDAPGKIFRKVKQSKSNNGTSGSNVNNTVDPQLNPSVVNNPQDTNSSGMVTKAATSDFVPGTKVILSENFSSTKAGEFPSTWMTNSSGEVRAIDGQPDKWLQLSANGIFAPSQLNDLPENFTVEFDAIFHPTPSKDVHYIFYLYSIKDKVSDFRETNYPGNAGIYFAFNTAAGEIDAENFENGKPGIVDNHIVTDLLKSELANKVHVSISKQKTKLSLYINASKVFSSPTALPTGYSYNALKFGSFFMGSDDFVLITNLTVAQD